jgi:hypothetical protein
MAVQRYRPDPLPEWAGRHLPERRGQGRGQLPAFVTSSEQWVLGAGRGTETLSLDQQDLNQFGFLWDDFQGGGANGQGFATQGAAVEALSATLGASTAMC